MKIHKYTNLEEYKKIQLEGHYNARYGVWAQESDIVFLSEYLKKNFQAENFSLGICHGAKIGVENEWFERHLKIDMLGTDLAPPEKPDKNIEWDFHDIKDEWVNNIDFIYSNALDHSYDPAMCLTQWMKCIKVGGACILEWTPWHTENHQGPIDPFGASLQEYQDLATQCGFEVKDILTKEFETNQFHRNRTVPKHFVVIVHPTVSNKTIPA